MNWAADGVALLLTGVLGFLTFRRIANPIQALERSVRTIAAGDYTKAVPFTTSSDETGGLARSIEVLKSGAAAIDEQRWVKSSAAKVIGDLQNVHSLAEFGQRFLESLMPLLREVTSRAHVIPIEKGWAVVSDLFDPAPDQWRLRGDLFLWMEMRQALCHVEIPQEPERLAQTIASAFTALTAMPLTRDSEFYVRRFARGVMSSGMVSGEFWAERFIPLVQQRASWLQATWRR